MKASDKIALLVSGRATMKEIKALEEQEALESKQEEKKEEHTPEESSKHEDQEIDYKKLYEELLENKKDPEEAKPGEPDYKKLYEEESAKVTKLQKENINKDFKKEEKPESIEDIMIRAYSHS